MIKRKFSIILMIALLMNISGGVFAQGNTLTAQCSYDGLRDALIVDGTVIAPKGNIRLTLDVTGPDDEFLLGQQTVALADSFDEELVYAFEPICFGVNFASGEYTLEISGEHIAQPVTLTFTYAGVDILFDAMQRINAAIAQNKADAVYNEIKDNAVDLEVPQEDMLNLGTKGRRVFSRLMLDISCDIPENIDSVEKREQVKAAALDFRKTYANAIAIGSYNDIATSNDLKQWLEKHQAEYGINEDDTDTAINEKELFAYVEKVIKDDELVNRISQRKNLDTMSKIRNALYEDALLTIIQTHHFGETKEVMDKFPSLFDVNKNRFTKLSYTKQGQVYELVAGKNYIDYEAVAEAFDKAVDDLLDKKNGNGGSGGGGSSGSSGGWGSAGSSGGGLIIKPSTENNVNNQNNNSHNTNDQNTTKVEFKDLGSVSWAEEAILSLAEKGILAGKGEGTFSPDDSITRAEFIKMVVMAIGAEIPEGNAEFADVTLDDWYYPYIHSAWKNKIVMGDENNYFNPNAKITREDMTVILYRAYQINEIADAESAFKDWNEVSEYAQNAVAYFYNAKIVSGMGNGQFAPKAYATRAQAAVMIYNVINTL